MLNISPPRPFPKCFRNLRPTPHPLTTIIVLTGKNGLVMATDMQTTGFTTESKMKIQYVTKTGMLACAGTSNYIELFGDYVVNNTRDDYLEGLNKGIDEYCKYVAERIDLLKLSRLPGFNISDYYPEGILAAYDQKLKRYRVFEIDTPAPCHELDSVLNRRIAKGSGGIAASVILKTIENALGSELKQTIWGDFSTKTLSQLCYILLNQISQIDPYSSGVWIEVLTPSQSILVDNSKLFSDENDMVGELMKNAIAEMPDFRRAKIKDQKPLFKWLADV